MAVKAISKALVEQILEMGDAGLDASDIAEILYQREGDDFFADREDDSDAAISRRYGISEDDRFDIRGDVLLPRVNDAGEPFWI
jgi:hypothetical protein